MSVSFTLDSKRYDVVPGGTFTLTVTVTNTGPQVDQFRMSVRGLTGVSVTTDPGLVNLEGGKHLEARVQVRVPIDARVRAGRHVVGLHVWSTRNPEAQGLREFEVYVDPHPAVALAAYKRGRSKGRYQHATVAVTNAGNVPLRMTLDGTDPKNVVRVDLPEQPVEVEPFQTAEIDALLRGPLRVFGSPQSHVVKFKASGMKMEDSVDYALEQRAWLGKSPKPYVLIGLVAIAVFLLWPRHVTLENLAGQEADAAEQRLDELGVGHELSERNSTVPQGTVLETNPGPGEDVRTGGILGLFAETVDVFVSSGPVTVEIPNVVEQSWASANAAFGPLREIGVDIRRVDEASDQVEVDHVIRTEPASGELTGDAVLDVFVSLGPAEFEVPDFADMDIGEVRQTAESLGLVIAPEEREVDDPAKNELVVDQAPDAGESIVAGRTVTVWIGVFVEPDEQDGGGAATSTTTAGG